MFRSDKKILTRSVESIEYTRRSELTLRVKNTLVMHNAVTSIEHNRFDQSCIDLLGTSFDIQSNINDWGKKAKEVIHLSITGYNQHFLETGDNKCAKDTENIGKRIHPTYDTHNWLFKRGTLVIRHHIFNFIAFLFDGKSIPSRHSPMSMIFHKAWPRTKQCSDWDAYMNDLIRDCSSTSQRPFLIEIMTYFLLVRNSNYSQKKKLRRLYDIRMRLFIEETDLQLIYSFFTSSIGKIAILDNLLYYLQPVLIPYYLQ
mgnify:FL=1